MLDPAFVRDHLDEVRHGLGRRGLDPDAELKAFLELDAERRALLPEMEGLKRDQKVSSDEVARAKREGRDVSDIFAANKVRGQRIKELERRVAEIEEARTRSLVGIPNLPHASVPDGRSADDNVEVRRSGDPRTFDFEPKRSEEHTSE